MNKTKCLIIITLMFMMIGFATISVTLGIDGSAYVTSDLNDFDVYFSNVLVNDEQDLSLVKNSKELSFSTRLEELGKEYKITYDITNASKLFDASITITCTQSNNFLTVTNDFDTSTNLLARSTRTGTLTLKKTQTNASETDTLYNISCNIVATPISRSTESTGAVSLPLQGVVPTGTEVTYLGEKFYVISDVNNEISLLTKYNIDSSNYRQSSEEFPVSMWGDWEYIEEKDISDLYNPDSTWGVWYTMNNYAEYLKTNLNDPSLSINLITLDELGSLGCTIAEDYIGSKGSVIIQGGFTCSSSPHSEWLVNNQSWWTRSKDLGYGLTSTTIWVVEEDGELSIWGIADASYYGVRPVIKMSKETYNRMIE